MTIEQGNQYIYLREGDLSGKRENDDVVVVFNGDLDGELKINRIKRLYIAVTGKRLKNVR